MFSCQGFLTCGCNQIKDHCQGFFICGCNPIKDHSMNITSLFLYYFLNSKHSSYIITS